MSDKPAPVRHGLISDADWAYWQECIDHQDAKTGIPFIREKCFRNIPLFGHVFLGRHVLAHMVEVARSVYQAEAEGINTTVVKIARGMSKSTTFSIDENIHDVCYAHVSGLYRQFAAYRDPRILLVQETDEAAERTMNAVRLQMEIGGQGGLINAAFAHDPAVGVAKECERWAGNVIVSTKAGSTGKEPTILAIGVGGAMLGVHPKRYKFDDVVTQKNSRTAHGRSVMREWTQQTILGTIDPGTTMRNLCTPQYEGDLNEWLSGLGNVRVIKRPALNRFPTLADFEPVMNDANERLWVRITERGLDLASLWPCPLGTGNCPGTREHYEEQGPHRSVEWLIHEQYLKDPLAFTTQFMLELAGPVDARVSKAMLRFFAYEGDPRIGKGTEYNDAPVVVFPRKEDIVIAVHAWDHAAGAKRVGSETAVAQLYRDNKKNVFSITESGNWNVSDVHAMMGKRWETDPHKRPARIVSEGINFQRDRAVGAQEASSAILPIEVVTVAADKDTALADSGIIAAMMEGRYRFHVDDHETARQFLMFGPDARYRNDRVDANRLGYPFIRDAIKRPMKVHRVQEKGRSRRGA